MTLRHLNQKYSETLVEFSKLAEEKGLSSSVESAAEYLKKEKSLDITHDLNKDIYKLTAGLKEAGYVKEAEELENNFFIFKNAETHLYRVHDEDGEDIIDFAHQDGDVKVQEAKNNHGDVETILSQHKKIVDSVNKKPTGKNTVASILNRTANVLGFKLGQFNPGGSAGPVSVDAKRSANAKIANDFAIMQNIKKNSLSKLNLNSILFTDADARPGGPRWEAFKRYAGMSDEQYQRDMAQEAQRQYQNATSGTRGTAPSPTDQAVADVAGIERLISGNTGVITLQQFTDWIADPPTISDSGELAELRKLALLLGPHVYDKYFDKNGSKTIWDTGFPNDSIDRSKAVLAANDLFRIYEAKKDLASSASTGTPSSTTTTPSTPAASNPKVVATNNAVKAKVLNILKNYNDLDTVFSAPPSVGVDVESYLTALDSFNEIARACKQTMPGGKAYEDLKEVMNDLAPGPASGPPGLAYGQAYLDDFVKEVDKIKKMASSGAVTLAGEAPDKLGEPVDIPRGNDLFTRLSEMANKWSRYVNVVEEKNISEEEKRAEKTRYQNNARIANSMSIIVRGGIGRPYLFIYAQIKHAFENLTSIDLLENKIASWEKRTDQVTKTSSSIYNRIKNSNKKLNFGKISLAADPPDPDKIIADLNSKIQAQVDAVNKSVNDAKASVNAANTTQITLDSMLGKEGKGNLLRIDGNFDKNFDYLWGIRSAINANFTNPQVEIENALKSFPPNPAIMGLFQNVFGLSANSNQEEIKRAVENLKSKIPDAVRSITSKYQALDAQVNSFNKNAASCKSNIITNLDQLGQLDIEKYRLTTIEEQADKVSLLLSDLSGINEENKNIIEIRKELNSNGAALDTLNFRNGGTGGTGGEGAEGAKGRIENSINNIVSAAATAMTESQKILGESTVAQIVKGSDVLGQLAAKLTEFNTKKNELLTKLAPKDRGLTESQINSDYNKYRKFWGAWSAAANKLPIKSLSDSVKGTVSGIESQGDLDAAGQMIIDNINRIIKAVDKQIGGSAKPAPSVTAPRAPTSTPGGGRARPKTEAEEVSNDADDGVFKAVEAMYASKLNKTAAPQVSPPAYLGELQGPGRPGGGRGGGGGGGGGGVPAASKLSRETKKGIMAMENLIISLQSAVNGIKANEVPGDKTKKKYPADKIKSDKNKEFASAKQKLQAFKRQDGNWNINTNNALDAINQIIDSLVENFASVDKKGSSSDEEEIQDMLENNRSIIRDVAVYLGAQNKDLPASELGGEKYGEYTFVNSKKQEDVYPMNVSSLAAFYDFIKDDAETQKEPKANTTNDSTVTVGGRRIQTQLDTPSAPAAATPPPPAPPPAAPAAASVPTALSPKPDAGVALSGIGNF